MARFNPYDLQKLYRASGEVRVPYPGASAPPPRDWWVSLEANVEEVATFELSLELLATPPSLSPPCSSRFCVDPSDPTNRWRTGLRDADDPGAASAAADARGGAAGALWRSGLTLLVAALISGQPRGAGGAHRRLLRAS